MSYSAFTCPNFEKDNVDDDDVNVVDDQDDIHDTVEPLLYDHPQNHIGVVV